MSVSPCHCDAGKDFHFSQHFAFERARKLGLGHLIPAGSGIRDPEALAPLASALLERGALLNAFSVYPGLPDDGRLRTIGRALQFMTYGTLDIKVEQAVIAPTSDVRGAVRTTMTSRTTSERDEGVRVTVEFAHPLIGELGAWPSYAVFGAQAQWTVTWGATENERTVAWHNDLFLERGGHWFSDVLRDLQSRAYAAEAIAFQIGEVQDVPYDQIAPTAWWTLLPETD